MGNTGAKPWQPTAYPLKPGPGGGPPPQPTKPRVWLLLPRDSGRLSRHQRGFSARNPTTLPSTSSRRRLAAGWLQRFVGRGTSLGIPHRNFTSSPVRQGCQGGGQGPAELRFFHDLSIPIVFPLGGGKNLVLAFACFPRLPESLGRS